MQATLAAPARLMQYPRGRHWVACASLVLGLAAPGAFARPVAEWRLSHQIEGYAKDSVLVCLVAKRGIFGTSWRAERTADAGPDCTELVAFDPADETIYLAFPGALATAEYICSKDLSVPGRHPCKSSFFDKPGSEAGRRRLDRDALREALSDAKAFALAERLLGEQREQLAREREQRRAACSSRVAQAASLLTLDRALGECDGLLEPAALATATARRERLQADAQAAALREYRAAYAALGPEPALEALDRFIARYGGDDPDGLVPKARALREQRLLQMQLARAANERQVRLAELITGMESCRRQMRDAQAMRAREFKVSADSGTTNYAVLRRAAEIEFDCRQRIDDLHREYRALGGSAPREEFD